MVTIKDAVQAASKIDGWMSEAELQWLAERASERSIVVEIGSWMGRSSKAMGSVVAGKLFCVDNWFEGTPKQAKYNETEWAESQIQGPDALCAKFKANVAPEMASGKIVLMRMKSVDAAVEIQKHLDGRKADMVFIDGSHDYLRVLEDISAWRKLVVPGGILCGHDYRSPFYGVCRAVNETISRKTVVTGTTIWMEERVATYFVDLDGTFFRFGSLDPLPQAVDTIKRLEAEGHKIVWTTLRNMGEERLGYTSTILKFRELGIKSEEIVWDCPSPRIVVNDDGAMAVNHNMNAPLTYESLTRRG